MIIVLVPAGRGNWKTRIELHYGGPSAPGPLAFRVGQLLQLPLELHGLTLVWRVVEIRG